MSSKLQGCKGMYIFLFAPPPQKINLSYWLVGKHDYLFRKNTNIRGRGRKREKGRIPLYLGEKYHFCKGGGTKISYFGQFTPLVNYDTFFLLIFVWKVCFLRSLVNRIHGFPPSFDFRASALDLHLDTITGSAIQQNTS